MTDTILIFGMTFIMMVAFIGGYAALQLLKRKRLMDAWKRDVEMLRAESALYYARKHQTKLRVISGGKDDG